MQQRLHSNFEQLINKAHDYLTHATRFLPTKQNSKKDRAQFQGCSNVKSRIGLHGNFVIVIYIVRRCIVVENVNLFLRSAALCYTANFVMTRNEISACYDEFVFETSN